MPHSICGQPNAVNNNNLGVIYISNKNCDLGMVYDIGSTTLYTIYLGKTLLFYKSEIANMLLEKAASASEVAIFSTADAITMYFQV